MSTADVTLPRGRSGVSALAKLWAFVRRHVLTVYSLLFFLYLMLPIAVVIAFSFNHPKGRFNYTWRGFTWDNWLHWHAVAGIKSAITLSLEIALLSPSRADFSSRAAASKAEAKKSSSLGTVYMAFLRRFHRAAARRLNGRVARKRNPYRLRM